MTTKGPLTPLNVASAEWIIRSSKTELNTRDLLVALGVNTDRDVNKIVRELLSSRLIFRETSRDVWRSTIGLAKEAREEARRRAEEDARRREAWRAEETRKQDERDKLAADRRVAADVWRKEESLRQAHEYELKEKTRRTRLAELQRPRTIQCEVRTNVQLGYDITSKRVGARVRCGECRDLVEADRTKTDDGVQACFNMLRSRCQYGPQNTYVIDDSWTP